MNKKNNESINLERIRVLYHNACGYKRIFFEILKNYFNFKSEEFQTSAAVVNGMFSIELFLKFLYAYKNIDSTSKETNFIKGHQIWCLYNELDGKTKDEIRKQIGNKSYYFMEKFKGGGKGSYNVIDWRYLVGNKEEQHQNKEQYKIDFNCMIKIVYVLYEMSSKICRKPDKSEINLPEFLSPELTEESNNIINDRIYEKEGIE